MSQIELLQKLPTIVSHFLAQPDLSSRTSGLVSPEKQDEIHSNVEINLKIQSERPSHCGRFSVISKKGVLMCAHHFTDFFFPGETRFRQFTVCQTCLHPRV